MILFFLAKLKNEKKKKKMAIERQMKIYPRRIMSVKMLLFAIVENY